MRFLIPAVGALALAACEPSIPDAAAGVGFGDYGRFMRDREAQLRAPGGSIVPAPQVNTVASAGGGGPLSAPGMMGAGGATGGAAQSIAQEALASIGRSGDAGAPGTDAFGGAVAAATPTTQPGGGLTEQNLQSFPRGGDAVSAAEEQRRQLAAQQYEVIQPGALPERPADATNIVAYALSTTNRVGQQLHRRSSLTFQNHERNCAQFPSQDLAQEEFLRRGGPQRDPLNLDPNGDGFACWWDPEPFRAAARAANNG